VKRAVAAVAGLLAGATARAQPPQTAPAPVFAARVESVYVDAFVAHDGVPVRGLTAENFALEDEGALQPVELVRADGVPLVSVLAFDVSRSVTGGKLRALQIAGAAFLEGLADADEASLVTFNEEVAWLVPPTADKARVAVALSTLRPNGGTAVYDGLFAAASVPTSPARPLVVVFSDGEDNASWIDERQLKDALSRSNALVHVVGLAPEKGQKTELNRDAGTRVAAYEPRHVMILRQMAESTGGRFWRADSGEHLRSAFASIAEAMRHRYLLRFEPPPGAKPGWRRLQVRLKNAKGEVQARRGYWAGSE
jgi:VWFA-related protein